MKEGDKITFEKPTTYFESSEDSQLQNSLKELHVRGNVRTEK